MPTIELASGPNPCRGYEQIALKRYSKILPILINGRIFTFSLREQDDYNYLKHWVKTEFARYFKLDRKSLKISKPPTPFYGGMKSNQRKHNNSSSKKQSTTVDITNQIWDNRAGGVNTNSLQEHEHVCKTCHRKYTHEHYYNKSHHVPWDFQCPYADCLDYHYGSVPQLNTKPMEPIRQTQACRECRPQYRSLPESHEDTTHDHTLYYKNNTAVSLCVAEEVAYKISTIIDVPGDGWCGWYALAVVVSQNLGRRVRVQDLQLTMAHQYPQLYVDYLPTGPKRWLSEKQILQCLYHYKVKPEIYVMCTDGATATIRYTPDLVPTLDKPVIAMSPNHWFVATLVDMARDKKVWRANDLQARSYIHTIYDTGINPIESSMASSVDVYYSDSNPTYMQHWRELYFNRNIEIAPDIEQDFWLALHNIGGCVVCIYPKIRIQLIPQGNKTYPKFLTTMTNKIQNIIKIQNRLPRKLLTNYMMMEKISLIPQPPKNLTWVKMIIQHKNQHYQQAVLTLQEMYKTEYHQL